MIYFPQRVRKCLWIRRQYSAFVEGAGVQLSCLNGR